MMLRTAAVPVAARDSESWTEGDAKDPSREAVCQNAWAGHGQGHSRIVRKIFGY